MVVLLLLAFAFCLYLVYRSGRKENDELRDELRFQLRQLLELAHELNAKDKELKKVISQKKSSEVRTGLIAEQMAPFLEGFPYNPQNACFMGKPLDFVVFEEDGVRFVEVKSGKSQLSSSQRKIRDLIKENKVTFEIYRIKGE